MVGRKVHVYLNDDECCDVVDIKWFKICFSTEEIQIGTDSNIIIDYYQKLTHTETDRVCALCMYSIYK